MTPPRPIGNTPPGAVTATALSAQAPAEESRTPREAIDTVVLGPEIPLAILQPFAQSPAAVQTERQRLAQIFQGQSQQVFVQRIGADYFYVSVRMIGGRAFDPIMLAPFNPAQLPPHTGDGLEFDVGLQRPHVESIGGRRQIVLSRDAAARPDNPHLVIVPTDRQPRGAPRLLLRDRRQAALDHTLQQLFANSPYTVRVQDGDDGAHVVMSWHNLGDGIQTLDFGLLNEEIIVHDTPSFVALRLPAQDIALAPTGDDQVWRLQRVPAQGLCAPFRFLYIPAHDFHELVNRARRAEVATHGPTAADEVALSHDVAAILTNQSEQSLRLSTDATLAQPLPLRGIFIAEIWPRESGPRARPVAQLPQRTLPTPPRSRFAPHTFTRFMPRAKPVPAMPALSTRHRFLTEDLEPPRLPVMTFTDPPIEFPALAREIIALLPEERIIHRDVNILFPLDHSGSMASGFKMVLESYYALIIHLMDHGARSIHFGVTVFNDGVASIHTLVPLQLMTRQSVAQMAHALGTMTFDGGKEPLPMAIESASTMFPAGDVNVSATISDTEAYEESGAAQVDAAVAASRARGIITLLKLITPQDVSLQNIEQALLAIIDATPVQLVEHALDGNRLAYQLLKSRPPRTAMFDNELLRLFFIPAMRAKPQLRAILFGEGDAVVQRLFTEHHDAFMALARADDPAALDVLNFLATRTPDWLMDHALTEVPRVLEGDSYSRADRILIGLLYHRDRAELVETLRTHIVPLLEGCRRERRAALYVARLFAKELVPALLDVALQNSNTAARLEARQMLMAIPEGRRQLGVRLVQQLATPAIVDPQSIDALLHYDAPDRLMREFLAQHTSDDAARARATLYLASWGDAAAARDVAEHLVKDANAIQSVAEFPGGKMLLQRLLYAEIDPSLSLQLGLRFAAAGDNTAWYYVMMRYVNMSTAERAPVHAALGDDAHLRLKLRTLAAFAPDAVMRSDASRALIALDDTDLGATLANNIATLIREPDFADWFDAILSTDNAAAQYAQLADRLILDRQDDASHDTIEQQLWIWRAQFLAGSGAAVDTLVQQIHDCDSPSALMKKLAALNIHDTPRALLYFRIATFHAASEIQYAQALAGSLVLGDPDAADHLRTLAKTTRDQGIRIFCELRTGDTKPQTTTNR